MSSVMQIGAFTMQLSANFTRPNDTNAYAAGDLPPTSPTTP